MILPRLFPTISRRFISLFFITCAGVVFTIAYFALTRSSSMAADAPKESAQKEDVKTKPLNFGRDILPLLSENCFACHGPDRSNADSDLRLDVRENALEDLGGYQAVVPGNPKASEFYKRIITDDEDEIMPPTKFGHKLTKEQKDLFKRWIAEGAKYEKHWAYVAAARPALPKTKNNQWARSAIDSFVLARLEEDKLSPSPEASKRTLLRRLTLDLTGLPPSLTEIEDFLKDGSPGAYEKVVDRLLASPRYGEHMAYEWLDAARYADTNGYQQDATRTMWPWRDWVVRSLNNNMPFDKFVVAQIAGDLLPNGTLEDKLASGFHRNHMLNDEGGRLPEESRIDYVMDRVETTGTVFLGLSLSCARCHDHKYDPISQKEYYQLFSFFNNIQETGAVEYRGNADPIMGYPTKTQSQKKSVLNERLATLSKQIKNSSSPEVLAKWETTYKAELKRAANFKWINLTPDSYISAEMADMKIDEDGALFVYGKNPITDSYTIETTLEASSLTGLRLEALPHSTFTGGGFSRSSSGNFVITEMEVSYLLPGEKEPVILEIISAEVDFNQGTFTAERMIDNNQSTGWAVLSTDMTKPHLAVFKFKNATTLPKGTELIVKIHNQSEHLNHNIGRFRLSVSTEQNPTVGVLYKTPKEVLQTLNTEQSKRTKKQQQLLVRFFQKIAPQVQSVQKEITKVTQAIKSLNAAILKVMVMKELDKPRDTYILIRGTWDNPDKSQKLYPNVPTAFPTIQEGIPKNRLGLAKWLVDPKNPLVARVAVNRYWQRFFGTGIVKTQEDFGLQGDRPSHPKLLNWLATEFVESGWDVKALQKQIVMSATYRQSSKTTKELLEKDPYNVLLGRASRFRLDANTIRDQAFAISGLLVNKMGGVPVKPYQPAGVWSEMTLGNILYVQDHGEKLYRRTLYTFWRRTVGPTLLFDASTRQICSVRPSRTNTPLQALTLLNGVTYIEASRFLAQRMMLEGGETLEDQFAWSFEVATARKPSQRELQALQTAYGKLAKTYSADKDALNKLLSIGETKSDPTLDKVGLAARTGVASIILNLDEVITRE